MVNKLFLRINKNSKANFTPEPEPFIPILEDNSFDKIDSSRVWVYPKNYNILRIMAGMGGLSYAR